jgi:hypothetical protein
MVFNRNVELIGAINFPGSAFGVDVSVDGQYVVGGSKAVHANQLGGGGRIELIQLAPQPTPRDSYSYSYSYTYTHGYTYSYPYVTPTPRPTPLPRPRPSPHPRPSPP